jgi:nitroreductase
VTREELEELVDLARLCPSAANLQPLKFVLSWEASRNQKIFPCLSWAAYLTDWEGPAQSEQPSAYIAILQDRQVLQETGIDQGIAALAITLGAAEKGLGGCIVASLNRGRLREALHIEERYEILLVVALGKPAETVVLEDVKGGHTHYWRDEKSVHHVPKRTLAELIVNSEEFEE